MGVLLVLILGLLFFGVLLEMYGFMGYFGWFWMFVIEGLLAVGVGVFIFFWFDDILE